MKVGLDIAHKIVYTIYKFIVCKTSIGAEDLIVTNIIINLLTQHLEYDNLSTTVF